MRAGGDAAGAGAGLEFYLMPDFGKLFAGSTPAEQWSTFAEAVYAAMGQAFFMVSVGAGSMSIFGSYIGKERSLTGEALNVAGLDVLVAVMAGLIIFPACFAYGVEPGAGPGLVFVTLPSVFAQMWGGAVWGTLFFLFMSFAALSTVIAVFEMIVSFCMDQWGFLRERAALANGVALALLSLPCVLGFNVWAGFEVPGIGNIQAVEDFLMSNNVLPLGGLVFLCSAPRARAGAGTRLLPRPTPARGCGSPAGRGDTCASCCRRSSWWCSWRGGFPSCGRGWAWGSVSALRRVMRVRRV